METNKKRPYKKPQIEEVKLTPEEAVLSFCKTAADKNARGCVSVAPLCAPALQYNGT